MSEAPESLRAQGRAHANRLVFSIGAACVMLLSGCYWASLVSQGAPYVYHLDEPAVMARALHIAETGQLNPGWFHCPSLVIYLDAGLACITRAVTGVSPEPGAHLLFEGAPGAVLPYYVGGRLLTVALSIGTTLVTMLM